MALQRIDHVQVAGPPGCEPAARTFYGEILGLREIAKPPALADRGGVWFELGTQELHVGVEQDFRPAHRAHPALTSTSIDELAGRLATVGARVDWNDDLGGVRRFYTADPFGNRLEIVGVRLSSAF
jgi:catechol 2,3-dioxygenase-like lactoylglutathione lyase family enzyme